LEREGVRLCTAIGIGFISVLLATAFTVEWVCKFERRVRLRKLRGVRQIRQEQPA